MFQTLPASHATARRSAGGAALSIVLHAALLSTAVWLTARAAAPSSHPVRELLVFYPSVPRVEPPPRSQPATVARETSLPMINFRIDEIPNVTIPWPPELTPPPIRLGGTFVAGPTGQSDSRTHDPAAPYAPEFVDKPVQLLGGQPSPRYPELLRSSGVAGHVQMRFVVDTLGLVERSSIEVVERSHELFGEAVRTALLHQRFLPAEADGRRVRQLVVQTFEFRLHP